jgi:predicted short-subunit dehydrogenase-like oxidoreductase (DUF2520 family)
LGVQGVHSLSTVAKNKITIIGPGSLGSALALALRQTGYPISEVLHRDTDASRRKAKVLARRTKAKPSSISKSRLDADILWLCVPDRSIATVARELAHKKKSWKGTVVFHSSGALSSDELKPFRERGASIASLHPLMTFVPGVDQSFSGVPFAVEGDVAALRKAHRIIRDLGGTASLLPKEKKGAYHAWGAFTSPLLLALLVSSEQVAGLAGIPPQHARRRMLPILLQTIENYVNHGPGKAFSGPILRGDIPTLKRHLKALESLPSVREVYRSLATVALQSLPAAQRKAQQKIFRRHK